jgi:serine/threonine-protein kinase
MSSEPAERFARLRELFHASVELDPGERRRFLASLTTTDAELLDDLQGLLAAEAAAGDFLGAAVAEQEQAMRVEMGGGVEGRRLGPYQVERLLAEGGMGAVYLARRADGAYDQRVAIKLIRPGQLTAHLRGRFLAERQALAALDHPNIACLLDGGTTGEGVPYLVMEYVEGSAIDAYCREHDLDVRDRIALFLSACAAVEYAHRNLVIHRDLKPANIMVTAEGQVKLLDFGIAKLLQPAGLAATAPLTELHPSHLTLAYASPEQVSGRPVSTASDVYSLGVVLYELLTDRLPYSLDDRPLPEVCRIVCEQDPAPPSQAASAGVSAGAARRLRRALRGDLDTIVMVALRKEPDRRYGSAAALAEDLARHLDSRPITARYDSRRYRAVRFVRRYRVAVTAAFLLAITLVGGIAATTWQARRAQAEAVRARTERAKAEQVSAFLQEMLAAADADSAEDLERPRGAHVTVAAVLDAASARVGRFSDQPEVAAALRRALGNSYRGLGLYQPAFRELEDSAALTRRVFGDTHIETARALYWLEIAYFYGARYREAEALAEQISALVARLPVPPTLPEQIAVATMLGLVRGVAGDHDGAESQLSEALRLSRAAGAPAAIGNALANLGQARDLRGDLAGAERLYREALTMLPRQSWQYGHALALLSDVVVLRGDLEEAERLLRDALATFAATTGESYHWAARAHRSMGGLLLARGEIEAAEAETRRALRILGSVPGVPVDLAYVRASLGRVLLEQGRHDEAERELRAALEAAQPFPRRFTLPLSQSLLGECLSAREHDAEAELLLLAGYEGLRSIQGEGHPRTRDALQRLTRFHDRRGRRATGRGPGR